MTGEIILTDILMVLVVGLIGGFVHDALQGAFQFPGNDPSTTPPSYKLGIIGDLVVGAAAAFVTYGSTVTTTPSTTQLQLVILAFTSGIGGSAILTTYVSQKQLTKYRERLKENKLPVD
jgi:hypothetical protein